MEKIDFLPEILKVSGLDTNGDKQVEYEVVLLQNVLEAMDVYAIYYHNRALADASQEHSASNIQAVSRCEGDERRQLLFAYEQWKYGENFDDIDKKRIESFLSKQ